MAFRYVKFLVALLSAVVSFIFGASARAWDNPGHMAVAGIAYDELSISERQRLVAILRQHPYLDPLTQGLGTGVTDGRNLVMAAATWPDLIKRDSGFTDNGYDEIGPIMSVHFDHIMHKGWHFIDNPLSLDGTIGPPKPTGSTVDAVTVLGVLQRQLHSDESDSAKAYDLGWMLHLVGDLHQPLHCVTGVTAAMPKGDTGGNDVIISGQTNGETELHAFWDDVLGKSAPADRVTHRARLDKDIVTADGIIAGIGNAPLPADKDSTDPNLWATDCFAMAKSDAYDLPDLQTGQTTRNGETVTVETATLDIAYSDTAMRDARQQIRLAGHRLALILAPILDQAQ